MQLAQQKAVCEISPLDRNRLRLTTTIHLKNSTTKKFQNQIQRQNKNKNFNPFLALCFLFKISKKTP